MNRIQHHRTTPPDELAPPQPIVDPIDELLRSGRPRRATKRTFKGSLYNQEIKKKREDSNPPEIANLTRLDIPQGLMADDIPIPNSYKQAIRSKYALHWREAMDSELESLRETETYQDVQRPTNTEVLPTHWRFDVKRNADGTVSRFKARVVAGGDLQTTPDGMSFYSPVAS